MAAEVERRRALDGVCVERATGRSAAKRRRCGRRHAAAVERVAVELRARAAPRVEALRRARGLEHAHVRGQQAVQRARSSVGAGDRARQLERGDLAERVDARVGAARAGDARPARRRRPAARGPPRARPGPCGRRRALALPAVEVGPVVGERDAVERPRRPRQRGAREPGFSGREPAAHSGQDSGGVARHLEREQALARHAELDARRRCGRPGCRPPAPGRRWPRPRRSPRASSRRS